MLLSKYIHGSRGISRYFSYLVLLIAKIVNPSSIAILASSFWSLFIWQSVALAQITNSAVLPPIYKLLNSDDIDDSQCPNVTPFNTISEDTTINTQEDLNALKGVSRIEGDLFIIDRSLSVSDLSPLDSLVEITGSIVLGAHALSTVSGFNCLTNIGAELDCHFRVNLLVSFFLASHSNSVNFNIGLAGACG